MNHQSLVTLCFALFLFGCDKADHTVRNDSAGETRASTKPRIHQSHHPETRPSQQRTKSETNRSLPTASGPEKSLAEIAWNAIETSPETAHAAFAELPDGSAEKVALIRHYAMRLAEQDPEEAVKWASGLGGELQVCAAMSQIALSIAEADPLRAANMLSESGIAGRDFDVAVVQVIQRWAAKSPADAGEWVCAFQPGEVRTAGLKCVAERWLPSDASAAFAWLAQMKDVSLRADTARAMEGCILQQPEETQKGWLTKADFNLCAELKRQRPQALLDVGDNIKGGFR